MKREVAPRLRINAVELRRVRIWLVVPADTVAEMSPRMNGMFWLPRTFEQSLRMPPPAASPPLHFTIWLADGSNVNSLTVFVAIVRVGHVRDDPIRHVGVLVALDQQRSGEAAFHLHGGHLIGRVRDRPDSVPGDPHLSASRPMMTPA